MKTLTVIPVIDKELATQCVESILRPDSAAGIKPEDVLIVDNTKHGLTGTIKSAGVTYGLDEYMGVKKYRDPDNHNIGVPRAWNIGARKVVEEGYDYLIIMSQSMLFGPIKETTWIRQMETFMGYDVIENTGNSWHLIAFHRRVFERTGYFDTNFHPGYEEAIDFHRRMQLVGFGNKGEGGWTNVWVNALSQTVGHHSDLALAKPLQDYYARIWNGSKGNEKFTLPFGDKPLGYFPNRTIPELAKEYGLQTWW